MKKISSRSLLKITAWIASFLTAALISLSSINIFLYVSDENSAIHSKSRLYDELSDYEMELSDMTFTSNDSLLSFADGKDIIYEAVINGEYISNVPEFSSGDYCIELKYSADRGVYEMHFGGPVPSVKDSSHSPDISTVSVAIPKERVEKADKDVAAASEKLFSECIPLCIEALIFIISVIYLTVTAGRDKDGNLKGYSIDRMYTEACILLIGILLLAVLLLEVAAAECIPGFERKDFSAAVCSFGASLCISLTGVLYLSLVRNIKCHKFIKRSIVYKIATFIFRILKKLLCRLAKSADRIKNAAKFFSARHSAVFSVAIFWIYSVCLTVLGAAVPFLAVCFAAVSFAVLTISAKKYFTDFDKIKEGVNALKSGNDTYRICDTQTASLGLLADGINTLGEGIYSAVEKEIKAERMKTELITNVSHDLKTPLTSIINYADLLCKQSLSPNEANDYAKILKQKAEKLKNITQDLFDVSKVQSGNGEIASEKLNLSTLIAQAMAEEENEILKSGLDFYSSCPDNLSVLCDGRKMSRVFSNLITNAVLYSLPGTRVYINSYEKYGFITTEIKNISSYKMDFDSDEITERFVRGDKSRTTEGSGLGLCIAKSYTQACGGKFHVVTDGDLFKAVVSLKKA